MNCILVALAPLNNIAHGGSSTFSTWFYSFLLRKSSKALCLYSRPPLLPLVGKPPSHQGCDIQMFGRHSGIKSYYCLGYKNYFLTPLLVVDAVTKILFDKIVDFVFINGCWNVDYLLIFLLVRLNCRRLIIFPHGGLMYERVMRSKLRIYLFRFVILPVLVRCKYCIVNTQREALSLKQLSFEFPEVAKISIRVVPHCVANPPFLELPPLSESKASPLDFFPNKQKLSICAVGRISPEKNLEFLLNLIHRFADSGVRINLSFIGPVTDYDYYRRLIALIKAQHFDPSQVAFVGSLPRVSLLNSLSAYDALVVPSLGENFCYVAVEAWRVGIPVFMSDKVAISDELEEMSSSFVFDLSPSSALFAQILRFFRLSPAERNSLLLACRSLSHKFSDDAISESFLSLLSL